MEYFYRRTAMVTINGESIPADGLTVLQYLEKEGLHPAHVAVMLDGEILPKSEYGTAVLSDGTEAEIIGFVGGG
jgi:thiamine biosynthesis protein ThiS